MGALQTLDPASLDAFDLRRFMSPTTGKSASRAALASAQTVGRRYVTPILDKMTATPLVAASFVKLRSAYTGPCCQVRRVSDNAILDIGFAPDGIVDTALMIAFSGSAYPGLALTLVKLYDQSGAGNDLTQTTASNQYFIDLLYLRNGVPCFAAYTATTPSLVVPAGGSITNIANCAVFVGVGMHSNHNVNRALSSTSQALTLDLSPSSAYSTVVFANNTSRSFGTMQSPPNVNGCVVGINSSSTALTYYRNNYNVGISANPTGGATGLTITPQEGYGALIFNAALSASDVALLQYGFSAAIGAVIAPKACVLFVGDSRCVGAGTSGVYNFNKSLYRYLPDDISTYNCALGGANMFGSSTDTDGYFFFLPLIKPGIPNVAVQLGGVNDIRNGGSASGLLDTASKYATSVKAAGCKAVIGTLPVIGGLSTAQNDTMAQYNNLLRANTGPGKIFDALADFDLEPTFLPSPTTADFPDNLHENLAGYLKQAPILADAINSQLPGL